MAAKSRVVLQVAIGTLILDQLGAKRSLLDATRVPMVKIVCAECMTRQPWYAASATTIRSAVVAMDMHALLAGHTWRLAQNTAIVAQAPDGRMYAGAPDLFELVVPVVP